FSGPPSRTSASASASSSASTSTSAPPSQSPSTRPPAVNTVGLGGCQVAPADSILRARVDQLPVSSHSAAYIGSIGSAKRVHADFGSGLWDGAPIGIPISIVPAGTAPVHVAFDDAGESDKGPYAIPSNAQVEPGDGHVIAVATGTCTDYELYDARKSAGGS